MMSKPCVEDLRLGMRAPDGWRGCDADGRRISQETYGAVHAAVSPVELEVALWVNGPAQWAKDRRA